jgi:hypothetical protein
MMLMRSAASLSTRAAPIQLDWSSPATLMWQTYAAESVQPIIVLQQWVFESASRST